MPHPEPLVDVRAEVLVDMRDREPDLAQDGGLKSEAGRRLAIDVQVGLAGAAPPDAEEGLCLARLEVGPDAVAGPGSGDNARHLRSCPAELARSAGLDG
eukprot:7407604-Lingulodinium_polyedra.AAC.1